MTIRPINPRDHAAVLELINADRLEGQPECSLEMLRSALRGQSSVDDACWCELSDLRTIVVEAHGRVAGAMSFARHKKTGDYAIAWLHACENGVVISDLIDHIDVRAREKGHGIQAFHLATNLTAGLEALPARHRETTLRSFHGYGFGHEDISSYMVLASKAGRTPDPAIAVTKQEPSRWTLELWAGSQLAGSAEIGWLYGTGVIWHLEVGHEHRGQGHGRRLATCASSLLLEYASSVILCVGHDCGGARDCSRAKHLYASLGFVQVDTLVSLTKCQV
ncbi:MULTISPECIES: GNAT family N-acetyltransferase [Mesorhizobium]|uniref:GNAT family N-acetyltransferase n=1 Tax=Mesorhizobium australicum TaxID=536018 RepID=UPI0033375E8A